ncbi:MAG TPA: S-layer homology domain-containing protein [Ruminiclostridium sp.]|nr:S-layer homology domain-containing protein [Ruminiclostridium sp.]
MKFNKIVLVFALIISLCIPANVFANEVVGGDNDQYFKDISKYGWAKDAINYFGRAGVLSGDGRGNYQPDKNVTREEFATMLANSFNADMDSSTQTFSDVPSSRWSYKYIESTKEYLTGYYPPKGKPFFDPTADATREDVAVALAKMLGLSEDDVQNPNILDDSFIDADDVSFNLRDLMAVVVEKKIMVGSNGRLRPTAPITRAEVAVLLYKVMKSSVSDASEPLQLDVDTPETVTSPDLCISGTTVKGAKVKVNGYDAEVDSSGYFEINFTLKKEGQYNIEIVAVKNGKKAIENRTINYEQTGAKINLTKCPSTSNTSKVTIEGTISDTDDSSDLTINGEPVEYNRFDYNSDIYTFSYDAELKEGNNTFTFVVKGKNGKETTVTKNITYVQGAPVLTISQCPESSTSKTVTISGTVKDDSDNDPEVYINNEKEYVNWSGAWSDTFTLKEGKNTFVIKAVNSSGKTTEITKDIIFSVGAPQLVITQCPESSTSKTVTISGTVKDDNDSSPEVYINNEKEYVNWSGAWSDTFTLNEGKNTFVIKAVNSDGKTTEITKEITLTVGAPELVVTQCPESSTSRTITISGTVKDANDSSPQVFINNEKEYVNWSGAWSDTFTLNEGKNTFVIKSVNSTGKTTEITKEVTFTVGAPQITFTNCPEVTNQSSISIQGLVADSNDKNVKLYMNDKEVYLNYNGNFSQNVQLASGDNTFVFRAVNSFGKSTSMIKTIKLAEIVAPTLTVDPVSEQSQVETVTITGSVQDNLDPSVAVYVNDAVVSSANGNWSAQVKLNAGENNVIIVATNKFAKSTTIVKKIVYTPAAQ